MELDTDSEAFLKAVGRRMRAAREGVAMSLEGAAKELGIVKQTVGHWETGRNPIDLRRLRQLARIYKTTVLALIADDMSKEDVLAMTKRALDYPAPIPIQPRAEISARGDRFLKPMSLPSEARSGTLPPPATAPPPAAKSSGAKPKTGAKVARK